ncbi:hypothetical protein M2325_000639 [Methanococcus voltae PS]|uniref:Uncharacterized protein n=1 Tax=Methanococcus voltae PS TaxID=523842 RepID=A0ABT2EWF3_METVO|nr:hypothetical protein [Methanococcus voltae]MCS3921954.1 hypothetical protein [Methanococcus voltae PS]
MEFSMPFDSVGADERLYNAEDFADFFKMFVSNGVSGLYDNLKVSANGQNMKTSVSAGTAMINGKYYKNTEAIEFSHMALSPGQNRIDRIVLRLDNSESNRNIKIMLLTGELSDNPQPPILTRNDNIYELSLAQVKLTGGRNYLTTEDIIDERTDEAVCGVMHSSNQEEAIENWFEDFQNRTEIHLSQLNMDNLVLRENIREVLLENITPGEVIYSNSIYGSGKNGPSVSHTFSNTNLVKISISMTTGYTGYAHFALYDDNGAVSYSASLGAENSQKLEVIRGIKPNYKVGMHCGVNDDDSHGSAGISVSFETLI